MEEEETVEYVIYADGVCINPYEQGYQHGRQDVVMKSKKPLNRFDLAGLYDQTYASGYRDGQKEARSEQLTERQKTFLKKRAQEKPKPFDAMASYPFR